MEEVKLIPATYKDIDAISALAKLVWNQHYPAIISRSQIDYMLHLMYSNESLSEQLLKKNHRFFLIHQRGVNVGFLSVHFLQNKDWFLNKFYIDQHRAGKGLGALVFQELVGTLQPENFTLTVNRQNYKAINFYFKLGFKIKEVADFDIGGGFVMNDFVMTWKRLNADDADTTD